MQIISYIEEFQNQFSNAVSNENNKKNLLQFLKSYEIQRSLGLSQMSAFTNSLKTPTSTLSYKQIKKLNATIEKKNFENKKKRSKKYLLLVKYKTDIIALKKEKISYEKIAKALVVKYNIIKKLQPSRQNIYNFCKENKI